MNAHPTTPLGGRPRSGSRRRRRPVRVCAARFPMAAEPIPPLPRRRGPRRHGRRAPPPTRRDSPQRGARARSRHGSQFSSPREPPWSARRQRCWSAWFWHWFRPGRPACGGHTARGVRARARQQPGCPERPIRSGSLEGDLGYRIQILDDDHYRQLTRRPQLIAGRPVPCRRQRDPRSTEQPRPRAPSERLNGHLIPLGQRRPIYLGRARPTRCSPIGCRHSPAKCRHRARGVVQRDRAGTRG